MPSLRPCLHTTSGAVRPRCPLRPLHDRYPSDDTPVPERIIDCVFPVRLACHSCKVLDVCGHTRAVRSLSTQEMPQNIKELIGYGIKYNASSLRQLETYGQCNCKCTGPADQPYPPPPLLTPNPLSRTGAGAYTYNYTCTPAQSHSSPCLPLSLLNTGCAQTRTQASYSPARRLGSASTLALGLASKAKPTSAARILRSGSGTSTWGMCRRR